MRDIRQAKQLVHSALLADCGTGSGVDNNATAICSIVGAVDINVGGKITGTSDSSATPSLPISIGDLQLMKRIWSNCLPTRSGYWRRTELLHVAYDADKRETAEIVAALVSAPKQPLSFDRSKLDDAEMLQTLVTKTEICMRDRATALLRGGFRDQDQIVANQVATCGRPLIEFLRRTGGPTQTTEVTHAFAVAKAYQQLNRVVAAAR